MKNDNFILINEVGLRDGLQGVSQEVTIEQRLKIIDILIESGLKNIQVCSFVNPKKIPQMNNVEELVKKLPKKNDVSFSAFILNQYGLIKNYEKTPSNRNDNTRFSSTDNGFLSRNTFTPTYL